MSAINITQGNFPLTDVADLPNVTIAFPGEHWSNRIAKGAIVPGEAIMPTNYGGKLAMQRAATADTPKRMAIATRVIEIPDVASDSGYSTSLGPNEIKNRQINDGQYVHAYYSGVFHLTLVVPRAWKAGDLVGWDAAGVRPTGKTGVGSWILAATEAAAWGEVEEFRPFSANGLEGLLTVRSFRTQS
jgi:predicted RecA/RadA family phage recombinase